MAEKVQVAFDTLKKTFRSRKTRNIEWRKEQLKSLLKGFNEMHDEICHACSEDLGREAFYTELAEIGGCKQAIHWNLQNIDQMTKDECIDTELIFAPAKTWVKYEPLGVCAIYGTWNYPIGLCIKPLI
jgi:aldehyde dehydrogenase (NAD+)